MIYDFDAIKKCDHLVSFTEEDGTIKLLSMEEVCERCCNFGEYLDYQVGSLGNSLFIEGVAKPEFDVYKLMRTAKGDNKRVINYGLSISSFVGVKLLSTNLNKIRLELLESLEYLILSQTRFSYSNYAEPSQLFTNMLNTNIVEVGETTISASVSYELNNNRIIETSNKVNSI